MSGHQRAVNVILGDQDLNCFQFLIVKNGENAVGPPWHGVC